MNKTTLFSARTWGIILLLFFVGLFLLARPITSKGEDMTGKRFEFDSNAGQRNHVTIYADKCGDGDILKQIDEFKRRNPLPPLKAATEPQRAAWWWYGKSYPGCYIVAPFESKLVFVFDRDGGVLLPVPSLSQFTSPAI